MTKIDFLDTLPMTVICHCCGLELRAPGWRIAEAGSGQWLAINLVQCGPCGYSHMAAAGSNPSAHKAAQRLREQLLKPPKLKR
jgi:hypothetical protein